MINPVHSIQSVQQAAAAVAAASKSAAQSAAQSAASIAAEAGQQPEFKQLMLQALDHVNSMQANADRAVEQLATGGDVNPTEVLTSIQKADMSFRMMLQIRNKLVAAYEEVKNIRI